MRSFSDTIESFNIGECTILRRDFAIPFRILIWIERLLSFVESHGFCNRNVKYFVSGERIFEHTVEVNQYLSDIWFSMQIAEKYIRIRIVLNRHNLREISIVLLLDYRLCPWMSATMVTGRWTTNIFGSRSKTCGAIIQSSVEHIVHRDDPLLVSVSRYQRDIRVNDVFWLITYPNYELFFLIWQTRKRKGRDQNHFQ